MRCQQDEYSKAHQKSFYEDEQANLESGLYISLGQSKFFTTLDFLDIEYSDGNGALAGSNARLLDADQIILAVRNVNKGMEARRKIETRGKESRT